MTSWRFAFLFLKLCETGILKYNRTMCSELVEMAFGPVNQNAPPLTDKEAEAAQNELVKGPFPYPHVKRKYHDKIPATDPKYVLFSFVEVIPACDNASSEGMCKCCNKRRRGQVFGVACVRGTAQTLEKAKAKALKLVSNKDSVHVVLTCMAGKPFPLVSSGMAEKTVTPSAMEVAENALDAHSAEQRKQKLKEKLELKKREQEIKERNKKLLQDPSAADETETPLENYTTSRVKAACLLQNAKQAAENIVKYMASLYNTAKHIREKEHEDPSLVKDYPDLLRKTRTDLGISVHETEEFIKLTSFCPSGLMDELKTLGFA
ncbi:unknown protein [Grouper iridovirus]|uniref:Uncharacterized protein n=1 Tax=Grouper iridovirus TaxID=127569 RepID=Q5GAE8_9VIRU|nr:unknown protein [Grouper iridovirus]